MLVRVPVVGKAGILKDAPIGDLPPDTFTHSDNIRFKDGMAQLVKGYVETSDFSSASFNPTHANYNGDALDKYFLLFSGTKARACSTGVSGGVDVTRTSGDYSTTGGGNKTADRWVSDVFSESIIATNNLDVPQNWPYPSSTTKVIDLANWPSDTCCKSIKVFKNYFVALNITDFSASTFNVSAYHPHRVLWSHPAEPGSVPTSWDVTDTTKDAGQVDLPGSDRIVDGGVMRDIFVIYKERSTHLMQYIGGQFIFRFSQAFSDVGILAANCWVELNGAHVVLTSNDLVMHDGFSAQSLLDTKMKRWLFTNIDEDNIENVFLVKNTYFNEVWVCFPSSGSTWCDTALCWNWKNNTTSLRDLPTVSFGTTGPVGDEAMTQTGWGDDEFPPESERVFMVSSTGQNAYLMDASLHYDGAAISAELTRTGLAFDEPAKLKYVRGVRPRMEGSGQTVSIQIGTHDTLHGTVTYETAQTFTIDSDFKVDFNAAGRYIALKITSTSDEWKLESLDFDIEYQGDY